MADRYWVGGTNTWNGTAGTKWSATSGGPGGASVPTAADDVFFNAASGAGTVTIGTGNLGAKSITCTGFTGTLAGNTPITVSGNVTLSAGMTRTYAGTITFNASATITSAGIKFSPINVNGSGITVTLGDAFDNSIVGAATITVTSGTFNTANFNVTTGLLSSSGTGTRAIILGSSTTTLTGGSISYSADDVVDFSTSTNLTFSAGTSTINFSSNATSANRLLGGGMTFNNVNFNVANTTRPTIITGSNTFANLTVNPPTNPSINSVFFESDQIITGTLTCQGGSAVRRIFLPFYTRVGITRTLTVQTLVANDCDFQDITIAGFAAGTALTRAGNAGNNSGIVFPVAKTVYWNLNAGGNWSSTAWATTSGGTPDVSNFPLAQDTAIIESTGLNSGATITVDFPWNIGSIDMSGRTSNTMTYATGTNTVYYHGNYTLGTGVTVTGTGVQFFVGRGRQNITTAGRTIPASFRIDSPLANVNLLDVFNSSATIAVSQGTFNANGFDVTLTGATNGVSSTGTNPRVINVGSGTWTISGTTGWTASGSGLTVLGPGTVSMISTNSKTFAGGGFNYGSITINNGSSSSLTFTGSNTIGTLSNTVQPTSFLFTAGTTTVIENWNVAGTLANLVTIGSVTAATHTLSKASGFVQGKYLSISYSVASGGAAWRSALSTDGGNNTGWVFQSTLLAHRLTNTGNLLTNVTLDETASLGAGVATRTDLNNLYSGVFDEVTINPISSGVARRITSTGSYSISGEFDEVTGAV